MQVVEQIQFRPNTNFSHLCHLAKNLYNEANFQFRQFFFCVEELLSYYDLDKILKSYECYRQLPAQTSQQILKLVKRNWMAYFAAIRSFRLDSSKFLGHPRPPRFKPKNAEIVCIFTNQNTRIKNGKLHFPASCQISPITTRVRKYQEVRIVPKEYGYCCEIVYLRTEMDLHLNQTRKLGIDLGVNNIVAAVNNIGLQPLVIKGGVIKACTQFYNKINARLQSQKDRQGYTFQTKAQKKLLHHRNNVLRDIFHRISQFIINYCIQHDIGAIIIGYNLLWKQRVNLSSRNNQTFVQIPFARLIAMLTYKAKLSGITVEEIDEAYTSKCSFMDQEPVEFHDIYLGKRISRGLFRSNRGTVLNADINGAFNILKKASPMAFDNLDLQAIPLYPESYRRLADLHQRDPSMSEVYGGGNVELHSKPLGTWQEA